MQLTFRTDGTYSLVTTAGTATGNWFFAENESKLVFDANTSKANSWDIVELTEGSARFSSVRFIPQFNISVLLLFEMIPL